MTRHAKTSFNYRRLLQFRLRTLLVLLLLSSIAMGWWHRTMRRYQDQQEAITEIAWFAQHMAFEPGKPAWLRPFADEKVFQDIVHLSFQSQGKMTDEQMMHLSKMPRLRRLSLQHTSVTDQGLSHLSKLNELDTLSLESTLVTDDGLKHLSDLSNLRTLQLNHTEVTGKGLRHLAGMKSLQRLDIDSAHVSDDDLRWLVELPQLQQLEMHTIGLTEAGFSQLSSLRQLETLELHCARVRAPFESTVNVQLAHFAKLKSLTLRSNKYDRLVVSDLPQLTHLAIFGAFSEDVRIEALPRVEKFSFTQHKLSKEAFRQATLLPSLQALDLAGDPNLADSWKHLRNLKSIRFLRLDHTGIGGNDLEHLSGLTSLKSLTITGNPIRGKDLVHLRKLQGLTSLYLDRTNCFKSALADHDSRGNLRHSSLFSPAFEGGNGIEHLLALENLENLGLSETDMTFDEAVRLCELPQLKTLSCSSGWSRAQWAQLRRLVPNVNVSRIRSPLFSPRLVQWRSYRTAYVPLETEIEYVDEIRRIFRGDETPVSSEGN